MLRTLEITQNKGMSQNTDRSYKQVQCRCRVVQFQQWPLIHLLKLVCGPLRGPWTLSQELLIQVMFGLSSLDVTIGPYPDRRPYPRGRLPQPQLNSLHEYNRKNMTSYMDQSNGIADIQLATRIYEQHIQQQSRSAVPISTQMKSCKIVPVPRRSPSSPTILSANQSFLRDEYQPQLLGFYRQVVIRYMTGCRHYKHVISGIPQSGVLLRVTPTSDRRYKTLWSCGRASVANLLRLLVRSGNYYHLIF